ncbi:GNAT family N-acetyltransferase [Secundilactobacillus paracollinoides]|uniref:GNAT family N-acetyltransferase n=1 Tax=Secundilactobacillus paracollinoides TaxID=240427 RepID=UPI0006CFA5E0|nr:N-acetyltransferase [Secundilactobacillus paracollinoides]KRL77907.1 polyamine N-acetyltransferase [Secundilactobacillus paracollinoides DSM 15502 = JCM 11969]
MTPKITPVTEKDLATLHTLSIQTFTETFGRYNTDANMSSYLATSYAPDQLKAELTNSDSDFVFLHVNGQLAGYLKLNQGAAQSDDMGKDYLEVERIYIKSAFQHSGLGRTLITYAEEQAEKKHLTKIWLGVWEHNENAKAFYQRLGFHQTGAHDFFLGDEQQTDFIMEKELAN